MASFNTIIGDDINTAIDLLHANEVVAIPTETVYGLAGNALNTQAVVKIFEAKNRPHFNPLIVHTAWVEQISNYALLDEISYKLATKFMPGPFTLLLSKKNIIPNLVTAGSNKVAVRIPNHKVALALLRQIKFPLAAPSANAFGYVSPVTAQHVLQGLGGKIPYILNGGKCSVGLESTIVEVDNGNVLLHRAGGLAIEEIESVAGKKIMVAQPHEKPVTAGQLKSHYATVTPLLQGNIDELMQQHFHKKIAIISFATTYKIVAPQQQFILSPIEDIAEAAQNLFEVMRQVDAMGFDIILAEKFPNKGLGIAINDRLYRAQVTQK